MSDDELSTMLRFMDHLASSSQSALVKRAVVVAECESTQDECRRVVRDSGGGPGVLVTTLRQTKGRGRLGRRWLDNSGESVALTLSLTGMDAAVVSIAAGLAVCGMAEGFGIGEVGVRWPNDVMVRRRKLAGVLVENADGVAYVGVGINLTQRMWDESIAGRAISLSECGVETTRPIVIAEFLRAFEATLSWDIGRLSASFSKRDILIGTSQVFRVSGKEIQGEILEIDPAFELVVRRRDGSVARLPAVLTSIVHEV